MRPICYIHGFNSSPQSSKAQQVLSYFQTDTTVFVPEIPNQPTQAIAVLTELCQQNPELALIGSSLGGFYALYLANRYRRPAVLVNPVLNPSDHQDHILGIQTNPYTQEQFHVSEQDIAQCQPYCLTTSTSKLAPNTASQYMVLLQTDDELIDYRTAYQFFPHSACHLSQGGGHAFAGFTNWLPSIKQHFQQ